MRFSDLKDTETSSVFFYADNHPKKACLFQNQSCTEFLFDFIRSSNRKASDSIEHMCLDRVSTLAFYTIPGRYSEICLSQLGQSCGISYPQKLIEE